MKKWETPSIESLDVKCTENGTALLTKIDEIRVDQDGKYWVSFSGDGKTQNTNGQVVVVPTKK